MVNIFGIVDLFSVPVSIFTARRIKNNGSLVGFILSLFSVSAVVLFIIYKSYDMLDYKLDKY